MIKPQEFISFDKTENSICNSIRPEKYADILKITASPVIPRGAGLSYCNAGTVASGLVVDMRRMDKILEFDKEKKTITVEAGISIGELNNFLITNGFIFPVLPGYPTITVGGCLAFNVHGKSQFKAGTFSDWVRSIQLFHPEHGEMTCSPSQNPSVFNLTLGGMGLTGIVITVTLGFKTLTGGAIKTRKVFVKNIYEAVTYMQGEESNYEYVYSWNNLNRKGTAFGEGIVYLENYVPGNIKTSTYKDKLALSFRIPPVYTDFTVKIMCRVFYLMEKLKNKELQQDLKNGCFPIYNKEIYYYLFGRKGFREYQMLIPFENYVAAFKEIEQLIRRMNIAVSLGSLKLFKGTAHQLSFTGTGVCLTIDVRSTEKAITFFNELDQLCWKYKVIINLSKDSRVTHEMARKLFMAYDSFKAELKAFDPNNHISSDLKQRLHLGL